MSAGTSDRFDYFAFVTVCPCCGDWAPLALTTPYGPMAAVDGNLDRLRKEWANVVQSAGPKAQCASSASPSPRTSARGRSMAEHIMDLTRITLGQQIECVEREIAMRRRVYPGLVARKKMRQAVADYEIAGMTAVLRTLRALQERPL